MATDHYIGLMSGTSMDALDGVLVSFEESALTLHASHSTPFPADLRAALRELIAGQLTLADLGKLDHTLGQQFAQCAKTLADFARENHLPVKGIGSHGQTLWHEPVPPHAFSLQIGDPNLIAQQTGITTVADFRRRDMAAGGQGAPLVPAFHHWLFARPGRKSAVLNLGGIANITLLDGQTLRHGFDTGPANCLMDAWCLQHCGTAFDAGGAWARSGDCIDSLLDRLLQEPFFQLPPPKSTGLETFNLAWLNNHLRPKDLTKPAADVQRTLLELTARSVANSIQSAMAVDDVFACGGGAFNTFLLERLSQLMPDSTINTTQAAGLDPLWVEACAFAWLAMRTLNGMSGSMPAVTGAKTPCVLGGIYPGKTGMNFG